MNYKICTKCKDKLPATECKNCHKEVHKQNGCKYYEMGCKV